MPRQWWQGLFVWRLQPQQQPRGSGSDERHLGSGFVRPQLGGGERDGRDGASWGLSFTFSSGVRCVRASGTCSAGRLQNRVYKAHRSATTTSCYRHVPRCAGPGTPWSARGTACWSSEGNPRLGALRRATMTCGSSRWQPAPGSS